MTGRPVSTSPIPVVSSPVMGGWCNSEVKVTKYTYVWTINNFSCRRQTTGESLNSSIFSVGGHKWRLFLYPKGRSEKNKNYLHLYLLLVSNKNEEAYAKLKFSIPNAKLMIEEKEPFNFSRECPYWGWTYIIHRDALMENSDGLLSGDVLTILSEVTVIGEEVSVSGDCTPVEIPESRLAEDLGQLFDSAYSSDVIICVRGYQFRVHKLILTARSPVFSAMFEHKTIESSKNCVEIADVDYVVMREMLGFIYTGRAPNLDKMADELLVAADKYALERLKMMCEDDLCLNLTADNACEILALADRHSAEHLKSHAIDFINSNARDVMDSTGWKDFFSTNPLAMVFKALINQPLGPPRKRMKPS